MGAGIQCKGNGYPMKTVSPSQGAGACLGLSDLSGFGSDVAASGFGFQQFAHVHGDLADVPHPGVESGLHRVLHGGGQVLHLAQDGPAVERDRLEVAHTQAQAVPLRHAAGLFNGPLHKREGLAVHLPPVAGVDGAAVQQEIGQHDAGCLE